MSKYIIALLLFVMFVMQGCGRIETGHVGVRTDFNKQVETTELQPGFYTAFFTSVDEYVTKETEIPFDSLTPKGHDNLVLADFDASIYYKTNPAKVAELSIKYSGQSAYNHGYYFPAFTLVERTARGAIFDQVSKYDSLTIHTKRAELENDIRNAVQKELNDRDPDTFTVTNVIVRSIKTDPALEKSIQQAVQMQKQVEAKKQEVELARAEAERLKVESEGRARANQIIAQSLTDQYLRYKQIEMQQNFAKEGTHTVLFGNAGTPLINVK